MTVRLIFIFLFAFLFFTIESLSQVFIPFSFWRVKKQIELRCESGCYPTPTTPFVASTYYVVRGDTVTFKAVSSSNPSSYDFCFGPTNTGGCASDPIGNGQYPLTCAGPGGGDMDGSGSSNGDDADYTAPNSVTTDTCYVTDYGENQAIASASISTFNAVSITSPVTSVSTPLSLCVSQSQDLTGAGGLGTLNWTISTGAGSLSSATGLTTTYTAPVTAQSVEVQLQDSVTSMIDTAYLNIVNTIALTPTSIIETPINDNSFMQDPTTSAGTAYVANLNFSANCGLANYSVSCTGGGAVSPATGVGNNSTVKYSPASNDSISTVTFTDSTLPTAQTASQTVYNIVPVDIVGSWGYHTCVKYSHSTYPAGTYKLKCWGYNNNGQLGYGDLNARGNAATEMGLGLKFIKDVGITGADMMIKDVSVGFNHTCVILSNDTVKCWGLNTSGQLGYDNTTQLSSPIAATVDIGSGTPKKLYASSYKTCLVYSDDRMICWGRNTKGELGQDNTINYGSNGTTNSMTGLSYISVLGSHLKVSRVAGSENNTCVLTTASFAPAPQKVFCWGLGNSSTGACSITANRYCGELGHGTTASNWGDGANLMVSLPPVNLGLTGVEVVIDIAAGRKHICAVIAPNSVATVGEPICWGYNNNGQLGIDSTMNIGDDETPTIRIPSMNTVRRMELMGRSTCAIFSDDTVKCWGRGSNGQLLGSNNTGTTGGSYTANVGDDGNPNIYEAVNAKFGTGLTVKKMGLGYYYGCAILSNDFIKCWGAQYCGTGTTTTNSGCLLSGVSNVLDNGTGTPTMMDSRYIGDNASEVGDLLPYVND